MAFRKEALEAIGGFDPQFRVAGDDVDVCWRLQERGWTLGFSAGGGGLAPPPQTRCARYCRQQRGYGRAEALLERKWPERYNRGGHLAWAGRVYAGAAQARSAAAGGDLLRHLGQRPLPVGLRAAARACSRSLPLMPEWYLLIAALAAISAATAFVCDPLSSRPVLGVPVSFVLLAVAVARSGAQALRQLGAAYRSRASACRSG